MEMCSKSSENWDFGFLRHLLLLQRGSCVVAVRIASPLLRCEASKSKARCLIVMSIIPHKPIFCKKNISNCSTLYIQNETKSGQAVSCGLQKGRKNSFGWTGSIWRNRAEIVFENSEKAGKAEEKIKLKLDVGGEAPDRLLRRQLDEYTENKPFLTIHSIISYG